jgi:hypothetical protein
MKNGITIGSKNYTQIKVKVERIVHKWYLNWKNAEMIRLDVKTGVRTPISLLYMSFHKLLFFLSK